MLFILIISYVTAVSSTDLVTACPEISPVTDFDLLPLAKGIWYEIARYPHVVETSTRCTSYVVLEANENGFKTDSLDLPKGSRGFVTVFGKMIPHNNGSGAMKLNITTENPKQSIETPVMHYLYANNKDIMVSYGCDYNDQEQSLNEFSWIFSRTRALSSGVQAKLDHILDFSKAIDRSKYIWIDHSDC